VARLIAGELPTRIFYVSQGGYDTHQNQGNTTGQLAVAEQAWVAAQVPWKTLAAGTKPQLRRTTA
jgi:uncharacterized protein (DUF1501 family)